MKIIQSLCSLNTAHSFKQVNRWAIPVLMVALSLPMTTPAMAQNMSAIRLAQREQETQRLRTLTVTGQGKEVIKTTLTQVQLGVEVQGKTAAEAQQEAAKRSTAVVDFLQSSNVERLQTAGISLSPQYDYSNNQQRLIGYIASNSVSFRVATEKAGGILDQAVQFGATRIDGISFVAEDSVVEAARQQAIQNAIQNAQAQADAALRALGLTAKEVTGVRIDGAAVPPPMPYARMSADMVAQAASTPIVGGEQEVQASVTLEIQY